MRPSWIIGGLVAVAGLLAATAAGYDSITGRALPRLSGDVPAELGRIELCAALIVADGRQVSARMTTGEEGGAGFAARNDQFRAEWLLSQLSSTDATRDWRGRVEALANKTPTGPADTGYAEANRAYVECLETQNRDPAFTQSLHRVFGYRDLP